jgi:hypothetical protein
MENMLMSNRRLRRSWRVVLAIAALALAVVVTHYVFHRLVLPDLIFILTILGVGVATRSAVIPNGGGRKRKPPRRNT